MVTFLLLAGVLIIAGVVVIAVPLLRRSPQQLAPAPWAALAAAGVLVIGSAVLYATLTNWSWHAAPADDSPQTMVSRLARKLERDPQDLNGWLMLGRSYVVLEQFPLALRSFERADRLAGGKSAEALVGEAEALTMSDESELDGRAGRIIEQALALDPDSGKALFFGAAAAVRRGDLALGKERFEKLLSMNPPEQIRPILQQQIDGLTQRMAAAANGGGGPAMAGANSGAGPAMRGATASPGSAGSSASASASASNAASAPANAANANAAVRVHIELSPALFKSAPDAAPLFVFVRDPAQPGPPLAAKRLANRFPQTVELTPADSMVPGRAFAAGQKVQVVARIARSGNPIAGSGDPFGEVAYLVGHDGLVNIVIDHLTP
jgi:cytochrome c-type biogenesis protein CcmH